MSKINSITLAILSVLATSSVWAEEETFDTHFMIGGLNGEKFPVIKLMAISQCPACMKWMFI